MMVLKAVIGAGRQLTRVLRDRRGLNSLSPVRRQTSPHLSAVFLQAIAGTRMHRIHSLNTSDEDYHLQHSATASLT